MNILEQRSQELGWDERDPGSIAQRLKAPKAPPLCHCPPRQRNRLGGMDPAIDLERHQIVCRTCQKQVGPACRTMHVSHLRGLLMQLQTNPQMIDLEDCQDAGFLL